MRLGQLGQIALGDDTFGDNWIDYIDAFHYQFRSSLYKFRNERIDMADPLPTTMKAARLTKAGEET